MEKKPNWLFMVYMVAGDNDKLDSLAVQDLLEMERGVANNDNVQCFVMLHRKWPADEAQHYIIAKPADSSASPTKRVFPEIKGQSPGSSPSFVPVTGQQAPPATPAKRQPGNMGDQKTLSDFLKGALENYKAEHYCLVLWGHSYGLGFGREHGDKLTLGELCGALADFEDERGQRLELLGANTCTLAYAEAIFELRGSADFMVASEVFVPFAGWPYQEILSQVDIQEPPALGSLIATRYLDFYNTPDRDERVAMTLIDLGQGELLSGAIENLGKGIKVAIEGLRDDKKKSKKIDDTVDRKIERLQTIQDAFLINPAGQIRPVLDLLGLANDLTDACDQIVLNEGGKEAEARVSPLRRAAKAVKDAIPKLVVRHKAHPELADLNGVGVFAPFVIEHRLSRTELELAGKTEEELKQKSKDEYLNLGVFKEPVGHTRSVISKQSLVYRTWPDMVFDRLRPNRPAEIVDSAGVVRPADRSAVSHMVFAVDAAFRRLNRVVPISRARIVKALTHIKTSKEEKANAARLQSYAGFGPPKLKLAKSRSMDVDLKEFGRKGPYKAPNEPTEIVKALNSIEAAFTRVEQVTRRVVTDARFGIGPAAGPGTVSAGFDDTDKSAEVGFKSAEVGFGDKSAEVGFADTDKSAEVGFADSSIGDAFSLSRGDAAGAANLGSQIAFLTSDRGLGSLAVIHLFLSIARSFREVERSIAGLEDEVATFLEKPEFGAILSKHDIQKAIEDRIDRRITVLRETSLQALHIVRRVLAHPTFGIGPGPSNIGRGERESLAAQAGLSRQRLLLL